MAQDRYKVTITLTRFEALKIKFNSFFMFS